MNYGKIDSAVSGVLIEAVSSYPVMSKIPLYLQKNAVKNHQLPSLLKRVCSHTSFLGTGKLWQSEYTLTKDSTGKGYWAGVGVTFVERVSADSVVTPQPPAKAPEIKAPEIKVPEKPASVPGSDLDGDVPAEVVEAEEPADEVAVEEEDAGSVLFGIFGFGGAILIILLCRRST
jgi:hypothetical protein